MSEKTLEVFVFNVHLANYELPYPYLNFHIYTSLLWWYSSCQMSTFIPCIHRVHLLVLLVPRVFVLPYPCQLHKPIRSRLVPVNIYHDNLSCSKMLLLDGHWKSSSSAIYLPLHCIPDDEVHLLEWSRVFHLNWMLQLYGTDFMSVCSFWSASCSPCWIQIAFRNQKTHWKRMPPHENMPTQYDIRSARVKTYHSKVKPLLRTWFVINILNADLMLIGQSQSCEAYWRSSSTPECQLVRYWGKWHGFQDSCWRCLPTAG